MSSRPSSASAAVAGTVSTAIRASDAPSRRRSVSFRRAVSKSGHLARHLRQRRRRLAGPEQAHRQEVDRLRVPERRVRPGPEEAHQQRVHEPRHLDDPAPEERRRQLPRRLAHARIACVEPRPEPAEQPPRRRQQQPELERRPRERPHASASASGSPAARATPRPPRAPRDLRALHATGAAYGRKNRRCAFSTPSPHADSTSSPVIGNTIRTIRVVLASFSASNPAAITNDSHGAASTPTTDAAVATAISSPSADSANRAASAPCPPRAAARRPGMNVAESVPRRAGSA